MAFQTLAVIVLSGLLTGIFTWYAGRRGMFDIPLERHSHTVPTARGGGAGIVVSLLIAVLLFRPHGLFAQVRAKKV